MNQLPDWMYHAIEESSTCRFASTTVRAIPVALPVFLNHFDPDTGTLIISSPVAMKRVENVRQHPKGGNPFLVGWHRARGAKTCAAGARIGRGR